MTDAEKQELAELKESNRLQPANEKIPYEQVNYMKR